MYDESRSLKVIPADVLEEGGSYQFRIMGVNEYGTSSATTEVETMMLPGQGSCQVRT